MTSAQSSSFVELRDAIDSAIFDAYAGGASGAGWTFMGDLIPADEMKARILHDPDKMRHIGKITAAVWAVVEERVEDA
jgi:hypothetical protein